MKPAHLLPAPATLAALTLSVCAAWLTLPAAQAAPEPALPVAASLANFADLADLTVPAVVNIRTTGKPAADKGDADKDGKAEKGGTDGKGKQADQDERMREFLRRFFGAPQQQQQQKPQQPDDGDDGDDDGDEQSVGAGFIIAADGYVLSNAHVIEGADTITVTLSDQREFEARVIGVDARTDIALLKIDGKDLPQATIGSSARARVGEWVIAIGSPFDLDHTVTAGIISAKARETGDFLPLIQTDVAVNPGNSGGPLINMRGEVVGINSQIYSQSGGYMGISFAIPIDDAMRVAEQLKTSGHVTRGRMGVYLGDVDKQVATTLGLPDAHGGLVGRIEKGGPAEKAGLHGGDIILSFNGVAVQKSADLRRLAAALRPGTEVKLEYWRKGLRRDAALTLAELAPDHAPESAPRPPALRPEQE
ncbi:trypsin-like peptidase domain-containing protein [Rugamonas sp.]|uniref:trypsin-like peptidase domain-containing protein n=1 Tax=Rugamonas sp. TaxID=1926287 RepID=UPI0025E24CE0|nr:trypsin-like peptidase domain-containing protein [Rugamonas sp.]